MTSSVPSAERRARVGLALAVGALMVAVLVAHAALYLPFISDDALISLRYADRLVHGEGLTWTDGERVEGYSNLLWVLMCAGIGALGCDLIVASRALGFVLAAAAVAAVPWRHPPSRTEGPLPALTGGLGLALSGAMAVWTVGGLEQALLAALLAWGLALGCARRWTAAGVLLGLLCWTRPDAPLFALGCALGAVAAFGPDRRAGRAAVRLLGFPAAAWTAQLFFRLAYYGDWLPNPARAKLGFTVTRWLEGARYAAEGLGYHAGLAVPAVVLAVWSWRRSWRTRFLAPVPLLWTGYVVAIGGDGFPARRHLVPVAVALALMVAEGAATWIRERPRARVASWGGAVLSWALLATLQAVDPANERARLERWEWDGEVIGGVLQRAFGERRPLAAVDAGGTLPYFSRLPALDMLGINDRWLARHPPPDFGHGPLGHDLGNGRYVLDREPDLVVFCGPGGSVQPCFRSGREMVRDPRFRALYRPVRIRGDEPYPLTSLIWVRAEAGRIGVQREAERVSIPGFLFSGAAGHPASLDGEGNLSVELDPDAPAGYPALPLAAGPWRVDASGEGERPRIRVASREGMLYDGPPGGSMSLGQERPVDVLVTGPPGSRLTEVRLVRAP